LISTLFSFFLISTLFFFLIFYLFFFLIFHLFPFFLIFHLSSFFNFSNANRYFRAVRFHFASSRFVFSALAFGRETKRRSLHENLVIAAPQNSKGNNLKVENKYQLLIN